MYIYQTLQTANNLLTIVKNSCTDIIDHQIVYDPVTVATGQTYSSGNLARWFDFRQTCPMTKVPLSTKLPKPNVSIKTSLLGLFSECERNINLAEKELQQNNQNSENTA